MQFERMKRVTDLYTKEFLRQQYSLHKDYYLARKRATFHVKVRLPSIPEDITENIIKFAIQKYRKDGTCRWDCKGDLVSAQNGKQECKSFISSGPLSFTPTSDWDEIYFLDARRLLEEDIIILFRSGLRRTSPEWMNLKINKRQTFEDQISQGRRPRISWDLLYPQIHPFCEKVFEGKLSEILEEETF